MRCILSFVTNRRTHFVEGVVQLEIDARLESVAAILVCALLLSCVQMKSEFRSSQSQLQTAFSKMERGAQLQLSNS